MALNQPAKGTKMIILALFPFLFLAVAFIIMSTSEADIEKIHELNEAYQAKFTSKDFEKELPLAQTSNLAA